MTLALTVLNYACGRVHPPWHLVHMALAGGQSDVRMAHSLDCRHARTGHRCEGRLLLPFVGHHPVQAHDRQLVIMFRRPAQRLISAFRDNYHAWGLGAEKRNAMKRSNPTVHPDPDPNPNANLNPNANANPNTNPNPNPNPNPNQVASWARYPGIAGCMTKMLAGYDCGAARVPPRDELLRRALGVLRSPRVAFVGLVGQWHTSICLFHRMMGGGTRPWLAEFRQLGHSRNSVRKGRRALAPVGSTSDAPARGSPLHRAAEVRQTQGRGYNESELGGFVDHEDEAVYAEAVRIFRRNVHRYLLGFQV